MTRNVTAIFSILMRLRQAVLHPSLVLKRLRQNLEASKQQTGKSKEDKAADAEEEVIEKLLASFSAGRYSSQVKASQLPDLDEDAPECCICSDVRSLQLIAGSRIYG